MVALIFLAVIAVVFMAVVALEGGGSAFERRPKGLLTWIASGNWPAKIGGGLMIVGVGALLRYAAINFDVPETLKLGLGIAAAAALGFGSFLTANNPQRRVISLALGGAAFGVAYLTAYSAFALFGYLPTLQGLGLLVLTAVGAGLFAVSRSAVSLAVLSMVGAFIAPAFAVDDPGPRVVYGYYVAISVLTLAMVSYRGWRPLIHLSFLFTLAGSAFFAWTADYFVPENARVLYPLLSMLVAVHVAMPLAERRWTRGTVVESLDTLYLLALPLVAALTALAIAPSRASLAVQLWWFGAIWIAAAAWLYAQKREGMATHAIIGLLMLGFGLAARFRNLPWELVGLGLAVTALALSARRSQSERLHGFLAGLVLVLAAVHMIGALAPAAGSTLFFNERFIERVIGAGLMFVAALTLSRLRHTLDSLVMTVAIGWAAFGVGAEVVRLDLVSAWLIVHWVLALAGFAMYFVAPRQPGSGRLIVPLIFAIGLSALLAQLRTPAELSWVSLFMAGGALLAIALRPTSDHERGRGGRPLAAIGVPIVVAIWAVRVAQLATDTHWQFPLSVAAAAAIAVLLAGYRAQERSAPWFGEATDIFAMGFAFVLAAAAIFDIERVTSAVVLEIMCVGALVLIANWNEERVRVGHWIIPAAVIGVALVLQANLLRWFGPPGDLNALDVVSMDWPTLVSLLWASIGAALTIWGRRVGSRVQWSAGAAFLVSAAIKLVLLDFGSLGQLANILAVIAAGGVFMLVGWLAPMPPARKEPAPKPAPPPAPAMQSSRPRVPTVEKEKDDDMSGKFAWTVTVAALVLITVSQCRSPDGRDFDFGDPVTYLDPEPAPALEPEDVAAEAAASAAAAVDGVAATAVEDFSAAAGCDVWAGKLPASYDVHVLLAGGDLSANSVRRVLVDIPDTNVLLVFGTASPVNWTVSVTTGTNIVGAWLPNKVQQSLSGMPEGVPILRTASSAAACEFSSDTNDAEWGGEEVRRIFGRDPVSRTRLFDDWATLARTP
ncbi:MAG TPA: DUF2339 domain-containing protein [Steroidobacteraceae bacterium]|nr:DUF2339 domain-containing protein [Steroidobacteraceae bacterium]